MRLTSREGRGGHNMSDSRLTVFDTTSKRRGVLLCLRSIIPILIYWREIGENFISVLITTMYDV